MAVRPERLFQKLDNSFFTWSKFSDKLYFDKHSIPPYHRRFPSVTLKKSHKPGRFIPQCCLGARLFVGLVMGRFFYTLRGALE